MMEKKDWCTGWWDKYLGVDLSPCCMEHDNTLSTHKFFKCLKSKIGTFHASYITLGGLLGAVVKYPKKMIKRV